MDASFVEGFAEAYRVILAHRSDLLAGPLEALADLPIRVLARGTQVYGDLLERSGTPESMADGLSGSTVLEGLGRAFVRETERPRLWGVLGAEIRSLWRGDVPRFERPAGGRSLSCAGGEVLRDAFPATAFESLCAHVHAMSEADLERQVAMIRKALGTALDPGTDCELEARSRILPSG